MLFRSALGARLLTDALEQPPPDLLDSGARRGLSGEAAGDGEGLELLAGLEDFREEDAGPREQGRGSECLGIGEGVWSSHGIQVSLRMSRKTSAGAWTSPGSRVFSSSSRSSGRRKAELDSRENRSAPGRGIRPGRLSMSSR